MLSKKIEENLAELDFEPKLEISKRSLPFFHKIVILAPEADNPTTYIINMHMVREECTEKYQEIIATMIAAKAIRRRAQSGHNKPKFFALNTNEAFKQLTQKLIALTYDDYECDAEIVARIVGHLARKKTTIEKIQEILKSDATNIIEKLGIEFVMESIRLAPINPIDLDLHLYPITPKVS